MLMFNSTNSPKQEKLEVKIIRPVLKTGLSDKKNVKKPA